MSNKAPRFIKPMHPKTEISPDPIAIKKVLNQGWAGQVKIHGHRAQIHLQNKQAVAFTRKGSIHRKALPENLIEQLNHLFQTDEGFTVVDCEWLKTQNRLYLFDLLVWNGKRLSNQTYAERYELLPQVYTSNEIQTLPLLYRCQDCLDVIADPDPLIEGIVLKALNSQGFTDSAIIRCRKKSL